MGLNPLLVREFVRINNDKVSPPTSETINGTIVKTSGGTLAVRIDGSDSYIECDSTVSYNEGDRVIIDITDHTPTVTGNLTDKAVGEKTAKNVAQIAAGELVDSKIDQIVDEAAGSVIQQISGIYAEKTDTPKSVIMQYALSNNESSPPSEDDWSTVAPPWQQGKYMWQRTVTIYADDTESKPHRYIGEPTCISGAKGEDGTDGEPGISIVNVVPIYYCSSEFVFPSVPEIPIYEDPIEIYNTWRLSPSTWDESHSYYFMCSQIFYSNDSYSFTNVVLDSSLTKSISQIQSNTNMIGMKVAQEEYDQYTASIETSMTSFEQRSSSFELSLTTLQDDLNDVVSGISEADIIERNYIRFNQNGLFLGLEKADIESSQNVKLQLSNDALNFFIGDEDNVQEENILASFETDRLNVMNAVFNKTLQIGNFAFYPRSSGNLTFNKVV